MKFLPLLILSILSFQTLAQKESNIFSYYFKSVSTPFKTIDNFNETNFGVFTLLKGKSTPFSNYELRIEAGENLNIDESGIYVLKNKILNISRTEIRENPKYSISNGYLHGVLLNDSLAVALQYELFYFLMPTKSYLYERTNSTQILIQVSKKSFLVLSKETNKFYSALKLDFLNSKISLSELDLTYDQAKIIHHNSILENSIETFLLNPNQTDWDIILENFTIIDSFLKS